MASRRQFLFGTGGMAIMAGAFPAFPARAASSQAFRIGYQKSSALLLAAKGQGAIEKRLATLGVGQVKWVEFQFGPPLLEALSAGAVDFGATGDAPPVLAQSAGARLVYAASSPAVQNSILVPQDSSLRAVADLKGRTVAFGKGSSSHNFVVQALKKNGLAYSDIRPAFLNPADAVAAFASGSVDAWSVWDPYFAIAGLKHGARSLVTTADGLNSNSFYLAGTDFAQARPAVLEAAVDELSTVANWAAGNRDELARLGAQATKVDLAAQKRATDRYAMEVRALSEAVIAQQQDIADTFFDLKLIPRRVDIRDAVWTAPSN